MCVCGVIDYIVVVRTALFVAYARRYEEPHHHY
jgi:hypothetical protein